jgi:hypothetical protein
MALAALGTAALPALARSGESGAGGAQVVSGVVQEQFGVAVSEDGSIDPRASTIPVSVTRTHENGVEIVTISPLR